MKIGLLSDTHGYLDPKIFDHFSDCDEIWHAGDLGGLGLLEKLETFKPIRGVYGNIDGQEIRLRWPNHQRFICEGLDIWITHIGGKPPKYTKEILPQIKNNSPDIFICGHSHILRVMKDETHHVLYLNPGAAGRQGFHKVKTLLSFEIKDKKLSNMKVIELGKRNS